jgi:selenocysteine-specific elongation factor
VKEAKEVLGGELYQFEVEREDLVQVSGDVFFDARTYSEMVGRLRQLSAGGDGISVAEVRDLFNTSRKYALALMEHLDEAGITTRMGDLRQFRDRAPTSNS